MHLAWRELGWHAHVLPVRHWLIAIAVAGLVLKCFLKFTDMLVVTLHPKLSLRLQPWLLKAHLLLQKPHVLLLHLEISGH